MGSAGDGLAAGFVLAGGASRRMGSNKALLRCSETTLVQHVSNQVSRAAGSVCVVGPGEALTGLGLEIIEDLFPGHGPLGGIITALTHSTAEWNLIVACDMPRVTAEQLAGLLDTARTLDRDAVIPVSPDGQEHPLCGVYSRRSLPGLTAAWAGGTRSVVGALRNIRTEYLPFADISAFMNVNTPADWDAFRSTIR
jgi:molybdenum cofactor guanylyltransferase